MDNLLTLHYNADPKQGDQKYYKSTEDTLNGLIFNGIMLPEEIITQILSYVDIKSVLMCRLVCVKWNEFFKSNHFWSIRLNRIGKTTRNYLPWYVFYAVEAGTVFDMNILKQGLDSCTRLWDIRIHGHICSLCTNEHITLRENSLLFRIIREFHPVIEATEWFPVRFTCNCKYKLTVKFYDDRNRSIFESFITPTVEQWSDSKYAQVTMNCLYNQSIAEKIACIKIRRCGNNPLILKRYNNSKMVGPSVKLLYDSL